MAMLTCITFLVVVTATNAGCPYPKIPNARELLVDNNRNADDSYDTGTAMFVTCQQGYELSGSDMLVCMEGNTWDPKPEEVICIASSPSCPDPEVPEGATIKRNGDTVVYSCDKYLDVVGEKEVTCQDGQWSTFPGCGRNAICLTPDDVADSNMTVTKSYSIRNFGPGDIIQYQCHHGEPISGSLKLVCLESKNWDHDLPKCPVYRDMSDCKQFPERQSVSCPDPGPPENGIVLKQPGLEPCHGQYAPGDILKVRCNDGYLFTNKQPIKQLICGEDGFWDTELPICYHKGECPDPGSFPNGQRDQIDLGLPFAKGAEIKVRCDPGYRVDDQHDSAIIRCLGNGRGWDFNPPLCTKWTCLRPPIPENGRVLYKYQNRTNFNVDESITFLCNEGYIARGSQFLTCKQDMFDWDRRPPRCDLIELHSSSKTTRTITSSLSTTTPSYSSTRSNRPSRHKSTQATTTTSGQNSFTDSVKVFLTTRKPTTSKRNPTTRVQPRSQPTATEPITTEPSTPAFSEATSTESTTGIGIYTIDEVNKNRTNKTHNRRVVCDDPGEIEDATRKPKLNPERFRTFEVGATLIITCNKGFVLGENVTIGTMKCLETGQWDGHPRCISRGLKICRDPGNVHNAVRNPDFRKADDYYASGQQIKIICNYGYAFDFFDESVLTCLDTGEWDGTVPVCTKITCNRPKDPRNGKILTELWSGTEFQVGSSVTFQCEPGYELRGPDKLTCEHATQDWNLWSPSCELIKCPHPGSLENGRRIGSIFRPGHTVKFACSSGYKLLGSQSRTCLPTRKWSGTDPTCHREGWHCPTLPTPIGGTKMGQSYDWGDVVKVTCSHEFYLIGSPERKCLSNGKWSGRPAHCEYVHSYSNDSDAGKDVCKAIDEISMDTNSSPIGADLKTGSCQNGVTSNGVHLYLVFDVSGSIRSENLDFFKEFSKAIVDKVGVSPNGTRVALIAFDSHVQSQLKLQNHNLMTAEKVKNVIDRIPHYGRGTATASALRYIQRDILHSKYRIQPRNVLILMTDGKYNVGGDPVPVASELKSSPYNMDIYCLGVGLNTNKKAIKDIASSSEKVWLLRSPSEITTLTKHLQSGRQTDYEASGVGGPSNVPAESPPGGSYKVEDIRDWPWVATIHFREGDGACSHESLKFICGASLIDSQWLLTARSCFPKDEGEINASRLHVKIGSTNGKHGVIILDVSDVVLRKSYLDNDIALVKLKRSVVLTPTIRTVALPDQDVDDRSGWTVGFVYKPCKGDAKKDRVTTALRARTSQLYQAMMQRLSPISCIKKAKRNDERFSTRRSFCAFQRTGSACVRDKGFPFMVEQNGEQDRVVQTGILSWSRCCKTMFYTKVWHYITWIRETMQKHADSKETTTCSECKNKPKPTPTEGGTLEPTRRDSTEHIQFDRDQPETTDVSSTQTASTEEPTLDPGPVY